MARAPDLGCYALVASTLMFAMIRYAHADARIVTRAMQASTIAEILVGKQDVRVEIEVGSGDLLAFANVLPDKLYERIKGESKPLVERLADFIKHDWIVEADGQPLEGVIESIVPGRRVVRDEVTGEPLRAQPADAELVVRIVLQYALETRPQSITIRPPLDGDVPAANVGFVAYHKGLPVNDFRYLPGAATLDLDWGDPWYSRFRHPNLRRQFQAPLSAYLYVEPFEVRKEIIVRPKDLQAWMDLDLPGDGIIRVEQQEQIKRQVAEFLLNKNPVTIDGQRVVGRLDRIHFIRRTLRSTGIIEPAVDLDTTSATLGMIFVYPVDALPQNVSMLWELYAPKIQSVPVVASDEAGGLPGVVTPEDPTLEWDNYLKNPASTQLLAVASPQQRERISIPVVSVICAVASIVLVTIAGRRWLQGRGVSWGWTSASVISALVALISLPYAAVAIANPNQEAHALSEEAKREIVSSLLYNVYRAFDHHDEQLIYDQLAKSISGELLSDIYLETLESMEIKNQGGLRISVKEVVVTELNRIADEDTQHTMRSRWRVSGWIGHWGHVHRRENEHVAVITIADDGGAWKIVKLEVLDETTGELPSSPNDNDQGAPS